MHPVLQNVRNASLGSGGRSSQSQQHQQQELPPVYDQQRQAYQHQQPYQDRSAGGGGGARAPPDPPRYPAQHALPVATGPPEMAAGAVPEEPPSCGMPVGATLDPTRMYERDAARKGAIPEVNLFKAKPDTVPQGDYDRDMMYRSGQVVQLDRNRVLRPEDFAADAGDPTFSPAVNHMKAAELKRASEQTAFGEEMRNVCHQTRIRTALSRPEVGAGIYYLYDFVQTYMEHPDGRVKLNPQLVLVAQHAGNTSLAQRLWAIAEEKNAWLRDLIEMAYMIVTDPYLSIEQQVSAVCTTVVELSMKYAKLAAKNGYPSMAQMAKAQEFFYRVMQAVLDLGVQLGVYNNRPVTFRQKRMSEIPQMTDAEYMFGLTQALENRPPQGEFPADGEFSDSGEEDEFD